MSTERPKIVIETIVHAPISTVWDRWTLPSHVVHWNAASDDWHCPHAENDLRVGGTFAYRMAAKDGSAAFDFFGSYTDVVPQQRIVSVLGDGRSLRVDFIPEGNWVKVVETFETEETHTLEQQKTGWQAILDRFKEYVEAQERSS